MRMRRVLSTLLTICMAGLLLFVVSVASLLAVAKSQHWLFNWTTCMPIGFYRLGPKPAVLRDGDYVALCPEVGNPLHLHFDGLPGYQKSLPPGTNPAMAQAISGRWLEYEPHAHWGCADHLMPFAKMVAATAGQRVRIRPQGVEANGKRLANSAVVTKVDGVPVIHLPYGTYTVPEGYFWDYAPGNFAYTSAYYGPVPKQNVLGSLHPVLVIPGSQYWYHPADQKG